jgi:hypothetical protein
MIKFTFMPLDRAQSDHQPKRHNRGKGQASRGIPIKTKLYGTRAATNGKCSGDSQGASPPPQGRLRRSHRGVPRIDIAEQFTILRDVVFC